VLGTAAYLSPEQARGEEAGPRADIYSLGVVAYQLLSGRLPYEATSLSELALKQQRELPPPLSALNPGVSPELAQAVAAALSIDQEDRPGDALNFAEMLRDGYRGRAPDTRATSVSTRATRVLGGEGAPTSATRVASSTAATSAVPAPGRRLQPRPAAGDARPRRPPVDRAAQARPAKRRGGGVLAVFGLLLLVIAVVVVAVILATSGTSTVVHASKLIAHDFSTAFNKLTSLISKYTK
jgi:serine/threonine-protein kinase